MDCQPSHIFRAGRQKLSGFGQIKGNRHIRFYGTAQNLSGVSADAAGNVTGQNRNPAGVDFFNQSLIFPGNASGQTRTKQGIHDQIAIHKIIRSFVIIQKRSTNGAQPLLHDPAVPGHFLPVSHHNAVHRKSRFPQICRHGNAVTAVVAAAAENEGFSVLSPQHFLCRFHSAKGCPAH